MVVVPECGGRLIVPVGEMRIAQIAGIPSGRVVKQPTVPRIVGGNIVGCRKIPGFWVSVAGRIHMRTVHMGDNRNRTCIGGRVITHAIGSSATGSRDNIHTILGRIRPVERLINRQQVGQKLASGLVQQIVDPADVDPPVGSCLNGIGRIVELGVGIRCDQRRGVASWAIAPHGGR